ncbi:MAG: hypothetical protein WC565_04040 [Parcubacteria group bacterium]
MNTSIDMDEIQPWSEVKIHAARAVIPHLMSLPHGPGLAGIVVLIAHEEPARIGWVTENELKEYVSPLADSEFRLDLWIAYLTQCPIGLACIYVVDAREDDNFSLTVCAARDTYLSMSRGGEA